MEKYIINSKEEILKNINEYIDEHYVDCDKYTQDSINKLEDIKLTYPCLLLIDSFDEYFLTWEIVTKEDF
jgi:hypothetical protein